jgi:glycosyltransferase involved in cell wall biosynthesis
VSSLPTIHILLATYNGARYLPQQWSSLEAQKGVELVVHIADDGSRDQTVAWLEEHARQPRGAVRAVQWLQAPPRRSATRSFLLLTADAVRHCPEAVWFAYCDQDDIWLPDKLAAAHAVLALFESSVRPALYGGRTLAVDEHNVEGALSPCFVRPPSFRNALTQNIMGGNTMLMNRAAAELVAAVAHSEVVAHDWLAYQLVSGAEGFVHYDPQPFVRYRQHGENVIGGGLGWKARWNRFLRMLRGEHRQWSDRNAVALRELAAVLTPVNRGVLEDFERARAARSLWERLASLRRSGAYRQNVPEQLMLWFACAIGRL